MISGLTENMPKPAPRITEHYTRLMKAHCAESQPSPCPAVPKSGIFSTLSATYWLTLVKKAVGCRGFSGMPVLRAGPVNVVLYDYHFMYDRHVAQWESTTLTW